MAQIWALAPTVAQIVTFAPIFAFIWDASGALAPSLALIGALAPMLAFNRYTAGWL